MFSTIFWYVVYIAVSIGILVVGFYAVALVISFVTLAIWPPAKKEEDPSEVWRRLKRDMEIAKQVKEEKRWPKDASS